MKNSLEDKTFLVGVGAQKAGTTWLHDYLRERREVYLSPLKEMHFFDVKHRPDLCGAADEGFFVKHRQMARRWYLPGSSQARRRSHLEDRIRMVSDDAAYNRYFEKHVPARCSLFGEITPSYSLLPREGFQDIAGRFDGPVKIMFMLRDPVDRFYSQIRMEMRREPDEVSEKEFFLSALEDEAYLERTRYDRTYEVLRSVFPEENIFVGFFDTMFTDRETARLCRFLDIPFARGAYARKSNAAPEEARLDPKLKSLARRRFSQVYDFCHLEFGDRVPVNWAPA